MMNATPESSSRPEIRLLGSEVIDQIAAGEVVERPAHLVKELVENALDAGATSIEVEYDVGGRFVRVTDNGYGIKAHEIRLALARHATSKITFADDLWKLHSFGFRGEALASLAAVSRLTILSRAHGSDHANQVVSEFGKLGDLEVVSGNQGTTVIVEELFSNVPARLKFMKTEAGENSQIKATLRALALANENVEFRVRSRGRIESVWPSTKSFLERAKQILSLDKLYTTAGGFGTYRVEVVFASPHDVAGNTRSILLFVQNRWVQDRGLQAAINDAYRGLLMHGEYPIVVARLRVPPEEIDVNIHPTKSQIKFRDPQSAFRAVNRSLREGLERAPWLEQSAKAPESARKLSIAELTRPYQAAEPVPLSAVPEAPSLGQAPIHSIGRFEAPEFNAVVMRQKSVARNESNLQTTPAVSPGVWSRLQIIGQSNLTYIVAQDEAKLVFVDQHAAHERVAYERLMRAWGKEGALEIQRFLLPLTVELESDRVEMLLSISSELESFGLSLDRIGPSLIGVRAKPALISDRAINEALIDIADEMVECGGSFILEKKIGDICASLACHSVVRAGQALSTDQMRSLLEQMDEFPLSSFCPHGRPVSVEYPFAKLERDFGRIV